MNYSYFLNMYSMKHNKPDWEIVCCSDNKELVNEQLRIIKDRYKNDNTMYKIHSMTDDELILVGMYNVPVSLRYKISHIPKI